MMGARPGTANFALREEARGEEEQKQKKNKRKKSLHENVGLSSSTQRMHRGESCSSFDEMWPIKEASYLVWTKG